MVFPPPQISGDSVGIVGRPHRELGEACTLLYVTPVRVHSFSLPRVAPALTFLFAIFLRRTCLCGVGSPADVGWLLGSESLLGGHQSPAYTAPGGRVGRLQRIRRIQAWSVCQSYLCRSDLLFYFSPAGVRGAPFWRFRRYAHTGGTRRRGMSPTCDLVI